MIELVFWGVRGTNPACGNEFMKVGGHTSCVSLKIDDDPLLILDAGSGLYDLGKKLSQAEPQVVNLLISHSHLDHLMGFPFFSPLWTGHCIINIYSVDPLVKHSIKNVLLGPPIFPVTLSEGMTKVKFHQLPKNESFQLGKAIITTHLLKHPGDSTGYRIQVGNTAICYVTDLEHEPDVLDVDLIDFVKGCGLLIYDAAYTEEEFEAKRGWGHSTHIRAAEIAKAAEVGQLALFHQDPSHTDAQSDEIQKEAQKIFANTFAALQGMTLKF